MPNLFVFEKAAKNKIVVCCKLKVALYGLTITAYQAVKAVDASVGTRNIQYK